MSDGIISRPHYFERQFLRKQDFVDEQLYHVGMSRRHNIAQHTWGIVRGLEIILDDNHEPVVLPGLGVDGYGRVLVLPQGAGVATAEFDRQGNVLEAWLVYDRLPADQTPAGYLPGPETADNTFYRWEELARVELNPPDPLHADPRKPASVAAADLAGYGPASEPVDDPDRPWPLYLGRITRTPPKPQGAAVYTIDLAERPYAGLIGGSITSPALESRVRVQLGAEMAGDHRRFAIFLTPAPQPDAAGAPTEEPLPRLEVDDDGSIALRGDTTVHGALTVDGGAISFGPAAEVPDAQPWRIYHVQVPSPTPPAAAGTSQGGQGGNAPVTTAGQPEQLRIELGPAPVASAPPAAGNAPAAAAAAPTATGGATAAVQAPAASAQEVVIGGWSDKDKQFKPYLRVANDGTVTVTGNLVVNGQLQAPVQSPVVLSPEARAMATSAAFNLIANAPNLVRAGADAQAGGKTPDGRQLMLQQAVMLLAKNDELHQAFADLLKQNLAFELRRDLVITLGETLFDNATLGRDIGNLLKRLP